MKKICRQKSFIRLQAPAILLLVLMLNACKAREPIRIGFLAGTSGRVADSGISGRDAVQLAVEQCNREGGISGRKIQLSIKDDRQQPEIARQQTRELISEGVVAIIGPMTSDMAMAVTPIADAAHVVLMSPTATTEALSGKDDYFLRVASTSGTYARRSANYLTKSGKMRRVAVVYDLDNASFSKYWVDNFRESFLDNGKENMLSLMRALKESGFDGPIGPDHAVRLTGDSHANRQYWAYAIGHMLALRQAVEELC